MARQRSCYHVKFLIEREDVIWFGGTADEKYLCGGLCHVDLRTGEVSMFGPREGFQMEASYLGLDGVWAANRLWLATRRGWVEVTARKYTRKTLVE